MKLDRMLGAVLVIMLASEVNSYRILGFHPIPGKSQHNIFAGVLHQLAVRGHSVVYVTPVKPDLTHPNLEVRMIPQFKESFHNSLGLHMMGNLPTPMISYITYSAIHKVASYMYGDPTVQALIHSNETFDAVTMESFLLQEPVSALLHKFSCPAIEISTFGEYSWLNEFSGLANNVAYQSDARTSLLENLSFWGRLYNFYTTWSFVLVGYYFIPTQQETMDKYFNYTGWENRPSLYRLLGNRSLILINQNEVLAPPQPAPPHVKNVGGINLKPRKPLPEALKNWMDSATEGVIYLSFGSNLLTYEMMNSDLGVVFVKVFQELPQKIVMKWEKSELPEGYPQNILFYKWVPQQDLLAHKNCRVFITHGGYLSLTEAVYHGVPVLGIPIYWDQPKNMIYTESGGYGLKLEKDNVTYASLRWALDQLLNNTRYKKEAVRRAGMMRNRQQSVQDEAVFWIEHVIKYPNSLTPYATNLNFIQFHLIDIQLFILLVLLLLYTIAKRLVLRVRTMMPVSRSRKKID